MNWLSSCDVVSSADERGKTRRRKEEIRRWWEETEEKQRASLIRIESSGNEFPRVPRSLSRGKFGRFFVSRVN